MLWLGIIGPRRLHNGSLGKVKSVSTTSLAWAWLMRDLKVNRVAAKPAAISRVLTVAKDPVDTDLETSLASRKMK